MNAIIERAQTDHDEAQAIAFSRGEGKFDNTPEQRTAPDFASFRAACLADVSPRKGMGWIAAAAGIAPDDAAHNAGESKQRAIGKPHRCKACAQPRRFIGLDIDHELTAESFYALIEHVQQWSGFAYTTASHSATAPRCRLILELDRAADRDELPRATEAVQARLREAVSAIEFDASCNKPEQPLYLPTTGAETYIMEGAPLRLDELLAEAAPGKPSVDGPQLGIDHDLILQQLDTRGLVQRQCSPGKWAITCPWSDEHTSGASAGTSTVYYEPHTGGFAGGGFKCQHDHCQERGIDDVRRWLGIASDEENAAAVIETANFRKNSSFRIRNEPWDDPEPLDSLALPEPYPLDALPDTLRGAVDQYQRYGGQPVPLVACSALAVAAVAAQGLADVRIDAHRRCPLSLSFLVLAQSGERKTSADKVLAAPLEAFEREKRDELTEVIKRAQGELAAWEAAKRGIEAEVTRLTKKGDFREAGIQKERLAQHAIEKPEVPTVPLLRYSDVTPEALALNLSRGWPSAALWSDEAGVFFGSRGMGKESVLASLAQMNRLWDGGSVSHVRKQAESVYLTGRRLSVSLMVQPVTLQDALTGSRGLARGTGFLARYLVAWPESTMGRRPVFEEAPAMPALSAFHARITDLLHQDLPIDENGRLEPFELRLSVEARYLSANYAREVEAQLSTTGELHGVADYAAKSQEQAARLAGVLHTYAYGPAGEIDAETAQRGIRLARWYVNEALRVMGALDEPPALQHARLLDDYLAEQGRVRAGDVLRLGPYPLRQREARDAALELLETAGRARLVKDGREKWIEPNPALQAFANANPANLAKDGASFRNFRSFRIRNSPEGSFSDDDLVEGEL